MSRQIAFFDFDGTITTKDTMLELIRYHSGSAGFVKGLVLLSPSLVAMKFGIISNHAAKEKMLRHFFGGMKLVEFQKICEGFNRDRLPALIRPQALATIIQLQQQGTEVVVVSASAEQWVKPWCDAQNIRLLASCLETKDGTITGMLSGRNCHGAEKVKRIREEYDLSGYGVIRCYGDTRGDLPMLALGTEKFYKPFL